MVWAERVVMSSSIPRVEYYWVYHRCCLCAPWVVSVTRDTVKYVIVVEGEQACAEMVWAECVVMWFSVPRVVIIGYILVVPSSPQVISVRRDKIPYRRRVKDLCGK